jgi:hypothetical protein
LSSTDRSIISLPTGFIVELGFNLSLQTAESIQQLIQVTYASAKKEIGPRELESFLAAAAEMKCDNMQVITWDYKATTLVMTK